MWVNDLLERIRSRLPSLPAARKRLWITGAVLGLLAAGFFRYAHEARRPWENPALHHLARELKVEPAAVEKSEFLALEKLGAFGLKARIYRQIYLWYGALFAGAALAGAALTARWWLRWSDPPPPAAPGEPDPSRAIPGIAPGRWGWFSLAAGLVLALTLRAPYLDRAIYFDEQDNLRRNFHGYSDVYAHGEEKWRPADWTEALWENRLGNNPVLFSVTAQASLRLWRVLAGAERQRFDIVALRIPVLLAGLASLGALWWLLHLWGLRRAAVFALFLGAVHPMHIEYSIQARGYAFVMLFVPLALAFAWRAIRRGTWLDWFGMAFSLFFCLWSYLGSLYFALTLNAGILLFLSWRRFRKREIRATGQTIRLLAANAAVAVLFLFLMAPSVPQLIHHFGNVFEIIPLRSFWTFYAWSHYSTGVAFPDAESIYSLRTGEFGIGHYLLTRFLPSEPVLALLQFAVIPGLLLAGLVPLWKQRPRAALLLSLGSISPLVALAHQQITSLYFYYWYLVYALPCLLIGIGVGVERILRPAKRERVAGGLMAGFLAIFVWQTGPFGERPGRVQYAREWPVDAHGAAVVEFQRGRHRWLTYRDGRSICYRNAFPHPGDARAGRKEGTE